MKNQYYVPIDYISHRANKRAVRYANSVAMGYVLAFATIAVTSLFSTGYYAYHYYTDNTVISQPILVKSELTKADLKVLKVKVDRHENH
jgi:hypothetical protein